MEIYQLKVFLAVARCLNFTEAAESLNLTQPAVSAKIKSLESDLKTSLFDRLGRQIQLTEVGQFLVKEAKKLVELEAKIADKVEKFKQSKFNQIGIGCSLEIAQDWLPKIIYQYRQKHPEIETTLAVFDDLKLLEKAIKDNNIDLGFSEIISEFNPELERRKIASVKYGLIVASNFSLTKRNWQTLRDIKQKPLILLSDRFASHQIFVSRLAELGLKLTDFDQIETVDTIALMRTYLTQGNYIGFASDLEFQAELDSGILRAIDLQEFALPANIYLSLSHETAKAIINDRKIRPDWLTSHITQLQTIPDLQNLQEIELDRWVQPEFLQTAQQN
ncbi:LysR family transcriptional regulator [Waterburya agarophytonicola K14]|uniref:LysR family transcriptional regulator n=1 Tax=Waterburya agarophytonicola KI4 TaxID=2874699 RepID=A0A964FLL0_9CYAN|nr:LysR family transcriptional regulator [Waterburya agarophytonicola]MCC0179443.1 LysR family transcriptional regulator [Waterburya agarophytonicola KI4]